MCFRIFAPRKIFKRLRQLAACMPLSIFTESALWQIMCALVLRAITKRIFCIPATWTTIHFGERRPMVILVIFFGQDGRTERNSSGIVIGNSIWDVCVSAGILLLFDRTIHHSSFESIMEKWRNREHPSERINIIL